jgi:hypothetical protein
MALYQILNGSLFHQLLQSGNPGNAPIQQYSSISPLLLILPGGIIILYNYYFLLIIYILLLYYYLEI